MTDQEQIDALKAQVNYLREVLDGLAKLGNGEHYGNSIGNSIAAKALKFTPEQCLAEVKAMAIEEAIKQCCFESIGGEICYTYALKSIANTFREQAK